MLASQTVQPAFPLYPSIPHDGHLFLTARPAPKHATRAWVLIDSLSQSLAKAGRGTDQDFWWRTTGVTLAILMEKAQYAYEDQCRHLGLYYAAVVPELGIGPNADGAPAYWRSFMTDHFCPLEFSWEWNRRSELPTIRYSFEPVGELAGTPADPTNKHAALRFVDKHYSRIDGCDLLWFNHLYNTLVSFKDTNNANATAPGRRWSLPRVRSLFESFSRSPTRRETGTGTGTGTDTGRTNTILSAPGHESRCFLALDLNESSLVLKSYFMPAFKAQEGDGSKSVMSVIRESIESLPGLPDTFWPAYRMLMSFFDNDPLGRSLIPEIVATDCVEPEKSRIKIYLRTNAISLESALHTLCLGGAIEQHVSKAGLQQFMKLWALVWSDKSGQDEAMLKRHRTGGLLYYFELRPDKKTPAVKIYLPLRHCGRTDGDIARSLQEFIRSTPRADHSERYIESLEATSASAPVQGQNSTQTYLTCMIVGDELRITSYLAPVVYRLLD